MNRFEVLSWRHKAAYLVMTILGMFLFLAIFAEGVVRIRSVLRHGSQTFRIEELYRLDPGTGLRIPVEGYNNGRIRINRLGFRGPEIALPKPPGVTRLAFLGASTTLCAEASNNESTWPDLLVKRLGALRPGVVIDYVNGAVPGYGVTSSRRNLELRVAPLKPDIIVIYHATNDLAGNSTVAAAARGIRMIRGEKDMSWFSRYSMLWYLVEKNLIILNRQRNAEDSQGKLDVSSSELAEPFRRELSELVSAAKKVAGTVVLVTFSVRLRAEQSAEQKRESAVSSLFYMPYFTPDSLIQHYAAYNDVIREVARAQGGILIGGENDIPGDGIHFVDTVHFTDAGNRRMSERVANAMAGAGLF